MPEGYYKPRAVKWFTKAAENGHIEAMYRDRLNGDYPISLADASKAEDEAQRMFDDIQHHKGGTN